MGGVGFDRQSHLMVKGRPIFHGPVARQAGRKGDFTRFYLVYQVLPSLAGHISRDHTNKTSAVMQKPVRPRFQCGSQACYLISVRLFYPV